MATEMVTARGRECPAVLIVKGEHFTCDWPTDSTGGHNGWAHSNAEAGATWTSAGGVEVPC